MEWKTYTMEECDRFNGATGILGKVIAICSNLSYYHAKTDEEQAAIRTFEKPYIRLQINLTMKDTGQIDWIYKEVKPLIYGEKPKLTLEYILNHPHHGENF